MIVRLLRIWSLNIAYLQDFLATSLSLVWISYLFPWTLSDQGFVFVAVCWIHVTGLICFVSVSLSEVNVAQPITFSLVLFLVFSSILVRALDAFFAFWDDLRILNELFTFKKDFSWSYLVLIEDWANFPAYSDTFWVRELLCSVTVYLWSFAELLKLLICPFNPTLSRILDVIQSP